MEAIEESFAFIFNTDPDTQIPDLIDVIQRQSFQVGIQFFEPIRDFRESRYAKIS